MVIHTNDDRDRLEQAIQARENYQQSGSQAPRWTVKTGQ
jgi:hypothetical protein